jgi:hypothetical protein
MDAPNSHDMRRDFTAINLLICILHSGTRINTLNLVSLEPHVQTCADKFIATFLFNNYQQAQGLLNDMPTAIAALQSGKALEDTVYHEHLDAERLYLASRKKEPESDVIACEYVALLIKYEAAG